MATRSPLGRLFAAPEIISALTAVRDLAEACSKGQADRFPNPLFLHGPAGSGKTTLVTALAEEVTRGAPELSILILTANDLAEGGPGEEEWRSDLVIVEDMQHLPAKSIDTLAHVIDERQRLGLPSVFTATAGPGRLTRRGEKLPARLTNRLAGGLVVALAPLQAPSRLRVLQDLARRRKLSAADGVLEWLAERLTGGGRQLEGAVHQLAGLQKLQRPPLTLAQVREHFEPSAAAPTVDSIVRHVGGYYDIEPRQLLSQRRLRRLLLPRHVGMYLARRLTRLSLQQIGEHFGGRDHTTVLHACQKVEAAMKTDAGLSGAIRQMHAELA